MSTTLQAGFAESTLLTHLADASDADLDLLQFGVIGFDLDGIVRRYNTWESRAAGLSSARVLGMSLFSTVAPCMNNHLVAQRFVDAATRSETLDAIVPYVLTLRMRPTKVRLRLLAAPDQAIRYVLIERL